MARAWSDDDTLAYADAAQSSDRAALRAVVAARPPFADATCLLTVSYLAGKFDRPALYDIARLTAGQSAPLERAARDGLFASLASAPTDALPWIASRLHAARS